MTPTPKTGLRLATDAEARRSAMTGAQRGAFARAANVNGNRADEKLKRFD